jgi:hypothetical protein
MKMVAVAREASVYLDDPFPRIRGWRLGVAIALVLFVLAACGGGDPDTQLEGVPGEGEIASAFRATLVCSQECANRGFCGTSPDRGQVVLLNREGPSVLPAEYDLAIPENSQADIVDQRVERIVEVATGIEFDTIFFHLFVPERQDAGWAASWCVVQGTP